MVRSLIALLALFAATIAPASAQIVVIGNPDGSLRSLSIQQISDLYLGRVRSTDGAPVQMVDFADDTPVRERFFRAINGMDLRRVNAYWARLQFSGNVLAPMRLANSEAIVEFVGNNPRAIGYVEASKVTPSVRVIRTIAD